MLEMAEDGTLGLNKLREIIIMAVLMIFFIIMFGMIISKAM